MTCVKEGSLPPDERYWGEKGGNTDNFIASDGSKFQLDGNLGALALVTEALVQSRDRACSCLLLPAPWAASGASFSPSRSLPPFLPPSPSLSLPSPLSRTLLPLLLSPPLSLPFRSKAIQSATAAAAARRDRAGIFKAALQPFKAPRQQRLPGGASCVPSDVLPPHPMPVPRRLAPSNGLTVLCLTRCKQYSTHTHARARARARARAHTHTPSPARARTHTHTCIYIARYTAS